MTLNDRVLIIDGDEDELRKIKKLETYTDTSACFSKGGYDARREKKVSLMKEIQGRLVGFSGLTREIVLYCARNTIKIKKFNDNREHFDFQKKEWTHDELRSFFPAEFDYVEHQISMLEAMLRTNRCIIKAATSAGKSSAMSAFIRLTNLPTLILVNKVSLAQQLRDGLKRDGIDCGICSGKGVIKGKCIVSTIQSVKKIPNLDSFKMCIVDECHEASSNQFQEFLKSFAPPLMYGFSATPVKDGGNKYLKFAYLRQFLGDISTDVSATELMDNSVMAKPHIFLQRVECQETFDYASAYTNGIVNNDVRNKYVAEIAEKYDDGVLILVNIIEHGEKLKSMLPGSVFISGETSIDDRTEILKKFEKGEIKILIGSGILQEGISITNVKSLIYACSQKSVVAVLQKLGRALRFKKGQKTEVDFYDFIDDGNRYLLKHSKERIKIYKSAGFNDIKILD